MPIIFIGLIIVIVCVCFAIFFLVKAKKPLNFNKRGFNMVIFVLSLVSLAISLKLFWNMGVFADEYGSSPSLVSGGWFWLYMDWLRLFLLFALCVISGINVIKRTD